MSSNRLLIKVFLYKIIWSHLVHELQRAYVKESLCEVWQHRGRCCSGNNVQDWGPPKIVAFRELHFPSLNKTEIILYLDFRRFWIKFKHWQTKCGEVLFKDGYLKTLRQHFDNALQVLTFAWVIDDQNNPRQLPLDLHFFLLISNCRDTVCVYVCVCVCVCVCVRACG